MIDRWIEPGTQAVLVPSPERTPPAELVLSQQWEVMAYPRAHGQSKKGSKLCRRESMLAVMHSELTFLVNLRSARQ